MTHYNTYNDPSNFQCTQKSCTTAGEGIMEDCGLTVTCDAAGGNGNPAVKAYSYTGSSAVVNADPWAGMLACRDSTSPILHTIGQKNNNKNFK